MSAPKTTIAEDIEKCANAMINDGNLEKVAQQLLPIFSPPAAAGGSETDPPEDAPPASAFSNLLQVLMGQADNAIHQVDNAASKFDDLSVTELDDKLREMSDQHDQALIDFGTARIESRKIDQGSPEYDELTSNMQRFRLEMQNRKIDVDLISQMLARKRSSESLEPCAKSDASDLI